MIKLYQKIETLWFKIPRQIRFLCVGGFNTLMAYFMFVGLDFLLGYLLALVLSYALSINLSIFTMRHFVFCSKEPLLKEYSKACLVYLSMIACNYAFLWLTIEQWQMPAWQAQALFTLLSTFLLYQVHARLTFHRAGGGDT